MTVLFILWVVLMIGVIRWTMTYKPPTRHVGDRGPETYTPRLSRTIPSTAQLIREWEEREANE